MRFCLNTGHVVKYDNDNIWVNGEHTLKRVKDHSLIDFVLEVCGRDGVIDTNDAPAPEKRDSLLKALLLLEDAGVLVEADGQNAWPSVVLNLFNHSGSTRTLSSISDALNDSQVVILSPREYKFAEMLKNDIESYTNQTGLTVETRKDLSELPALNETSLLLVVGSADGDLFFDEVNKMALEQNWRIWLPVVPPVGTSIQIGPWIYPHSSACYQCYRLRKASVSWSDNEVAPDLGTKAVPVSKSLYSDDILSTSMLSAMIARASVVHLGLDGHLGQAPHGYVTHMAQSMEGYSADNHYVLRVPRCSECSSVATTGYPQIWFHGNVRGN